MPPCATVWLSHGQQWRDEIHTQYLLLLVLIFSKDLFIILGDIKVWLQLLAPVESSNSILQFTYLFISSFSNKQGTLGSIACCDHTGLCIKIFIGAPLLCVCIVGHGNYPLLLFITKKKKTCHALSSYFVSRNKLSDTGDSLNCLESLMCLIKRVIEKKWHFWRKAPKTVCAPLFIVEVFSLVKPKTCCLINTRHILSIAPCHFDR